MRDDTTLAMLMAIILQLYILAIDRKCQGEPKATNSFRKPALHQTYLVCETTTSFTLILLEKRCGLDF